MSSLGWRDALGLLALVAVALLVRATHFRGVYAIDDFNYLRHAAEIADGRFHLEDVLYWHGMRPFVFVPVAWAFRLFGVSEVSGAAWPLVASLLTVAVTSLIAWDLHGRKAAFFAGASMAFLPLSVVEATRVMPSEIMNLLIALSAFAFVRSEVVRRNRIVWLLLSGAMFAMIPWAGHLGLLFGAFFPVSILLLRRHPLLSYWPLAAGAIGATLVLTVVQVVTTGNPLANLDVAQKVLTTEQATPKQLFYLKLLIRPLASHGGVLALSVVGALAALVRRQRGVLLALGWFLTTYLLLEFGSSSLTEYRTLFKQDRYLSMIVVPLALLAGAGFAELEVLLRRVMKRRVLVWSAMALLCALVAWGCLRTLSILGEWPRQTRKDLHAIRDIVRSHEGETIYVMHWLWNTRVGFYLGYESPYIPSGYAPYQAVLLDRANRHSLNRYVQTLEPGEPMAKGILLIDEYLLEMSLQRIIGLVGPGEVPTTLLHPPAAWQLIDRIQTIAVYAIPDGYPWPGAADSAVTTRSPSS